VLPFSKDDNKVGSDAGHQRAFPVRNLLEMPAVRNAASALPVSYAFGQEWLAGSKLAAAIVVPDTSKSLLEMLQPLELSEQQILLDQAGQQGKYNRFHLNLDDHNSKFT
jgi:hypothetical protein